MKELLIDWEGLGDKTVDIIAVCHENRSQLERAASQRQTTFDSLMAAAIVEMIREEIEPLLDDSDF